MHIALQEKLLVNRKNACVELHVAGNQEIRFH